MMRGDRFLTALRAPAATVASPIDQMPDATLAPAGVAAPVVGARVRDGLPRRRQSEADEPDRRSHRRSSTPSRTGTAKYSTRNAKRAAFDVPVQSARSRVASTVPPNGFKQPTPVTTTRRSL